MNRRYNVDPVLLVSFYGNRIVSGIEKDASYFVAVVSVAVQRASFQPAASSDLREPGAQVLDDS